MMKRFIAGFLAGATLFGAIGAFAVSYIANPVDFKVLVNGEEFTSDPPPVEIEGRTYLPLRAMGDALGVPVNWNEELRQAEVGTITSAAVSTDTYSRNNPAPVNTVQMYSKNNDNSIIDFSDIDPNYSANLRVIYSIRGDAAWQQIKNSNMYNEAPKDGYEYIIARVAFSLLTAQNDVSIDASSYDFDFYSSNNEEYERVSVVLDGELEQALYAGGNAEGFVVGLIKKDDANPKLAYGLDYNGTNGIWFALK